MRETTWKRLTSWSFGDKNDLTQVECWVPQSLWWLHQLASLHLSPFPSQYCTDSSFGHILTRVASSLDSQPTFTSTAIMYWRLVLGSKLMSKEKNVQGFIGQESDNLTLLSQPSLSHTGINSFTAVCIRDLQSNLTSHGGFMIIPRKLMTKCDNRLFYDMGTVTFSRSFFLSCTRCTSFSRSALLAFKCSNVVACCLSVWRIKWKVKKWALW